MDILYEIDFYNVSKFIEGRIFTYWERHGSSTFLANQMIACILKRLEEKVLQSLPN